MGEMIDGQPLFPGENDIDQLHLIKKAFGGLTIGQETTMRNNKRYQGIKFP